MRDDMAQAEGCYRLDDGVWKIFIVRHPSNANDRIGIVKDMTWESGVKGIHAILDKDIKINKNTVKKLLSDEFKVSEWIEVRGPDSIVLR